MQIHSNEKSWIHNPKISNRIKYTGTGTSAKTTFPFTFLQFFSSFYDFVAASCRTVVKYKTFPKDTQMFPQKKSRENNITTCLLVILLSELLKIPILLLMYIHVDPFHVLFQDVNVIAATRSVLCSPTVHFR